MIVLAIAAPPGAGKSTLAQALGALLPGALVLDHDHYESFTARSPQEIEAWLGAGGSYDMIDVSSLVADLVTLRQGRSILDRGRGLAGHASRFVVLETPLGRAHPALRAHIDFLVWLDVPADVALARRLAGFVEDARHETNPDGMRRFVVWLDGYLRNYMRIVYPATILQRQRVAPECDLVLSAHDADVADGARAVVVALQSAGLLGMSEGDAL